MPGPVAARERAFAMHPRGVGDAAPYNRWRRPYGHPLNE